MSLFGKVMLFKKYKKMGKSTLRWNKRRLFQITCSLNLPVEPDDAKQINHGCAKQYSLEQGLAGVDFHLREQHEIDQVDGRRGQGSLSKYPG